LKKALTHCGFNDLTPLYIGSHGVLTANYVAAIPYSQMDHLIDSFNKPPAVVLSYTAIMNLKGLRAWMGYCRIRGQALTRTCFALLLFQRNGLIGLMISPVCTKHVT
jgi:hypothetical protein